MSSSSRTTALSVAMLTALITFSITFWVAKAHGDVGTPRLRTTPVLPTLEGAYKKALIKRIKTSERKGRRLRVFIKVGDSHSASNQFLAPLVCDEVSYAAYPQLRETVRYFSARTPEGNRYVEGAKCPSSFNRQSFAALVGAQSVWPTSTTQSQPLAPACARAGDSPVSCEIRILNPAWALVLLGTNDAYWSIPDSQYRSNLSRLVDQMLSRGVTPILSTLPPIGPLASNPEMQDHIPGYNEQIVALARSRRLPLINLWRAMQESDLVNGGQIYDQVHFNSLGNALLLSPCSVDRCRAAVFTVAGIHYGNNRRNLLVLRTLERIRRAIADSKK